MDDFDNLSDTVSKVEIDIDKQTTLVHYSHLFNLGNYENEKVGITVEVIKGQVVQDVIAAAEAEVNKQHESYQDIRSKVEAANDRLRRIEHDIFERGQRLGEIKLAIAQAEEEHPEIVKSIEPQEIDDDQEDDEYFDDDEEDDEEAPF